MYTKILCKLYRSTGDGTWSASPTEIDLYDVDCNLSLGEKNDSFSFKMLNVNNSIIKDDSISRQSVIKSMDKVDFYYLINGASAASSNLILSGLVKKVEADVGNKSILKISGVSFSEIATQAIVFVTANEGNNVNVMQFISAAINSITYFSSAFNLTVDVPSLKFNPVTGNYDGSAFPQLLGGATVREFNTSLSKLLDKYLQDEYTEDGRYYWYVTQDKVLTVRKKNVGGFSGGLTEGVDFYDLKVSINTDDVKNFIIVKCGYDSYGRPITTRYDNVVSRAKYGFRYYMLVDNIAGQLIQAQGFGDGKKFPSSYPYTTTWGQSTSNDDDFNDKLRLKAQDLGRAKGEAFSIARSKGFIKVSGSIPPTLNFGVGDRILLTSASYALTNYPMRVTEVRFMVDSVDLVLEEEVAVA